MSIKSVDLQHIITKFIVSTYLTPMILIKSYITFNHFYKQIINNTELSVKCLMEKL